MTTHELIELSLLDAMGLLDDDEQRAFDAAYRAATPAVQAHVRREQTRLSHIETLLPEVSPPAGLKAAVIEAVRRAMAEADAAREAGLVFPEAPSHRRVSYWWRAGAIGLATAAAFFIVTSVFLWSEWQQLRRSIQSDKGLAAMAEAFGAGYVRDILLDGDTRRVVFRPVGGAPGTQASVFMNDEWQEALLFCEGLSDPQGRRFKLAIVDESDRVMKVIAEFDSAEPLTRHNIPPVSGGSRLAILAPADGSEPGPVVSRGDLSS